jgi:hypothetical protein
MNIFLIRKNHQISTQLLRQNAQIEVPRGTLVPPVRGLDRKGNKVLVDLPANRKTLLLVFSVHCAFCNQNWPNWESLIKNLDQKNVNIALVDLSSSADQTYLHSHFADSLTTISRVDPAMLVSYRMGVVPQTILIGEDVKVKGVWTGVLDAKDESNIFAECSKN